MKKYLNFILIIIVLLTNITSVFADENKNQEDNKDKILNIYNLEYTHILTNESNNVKDIKVELMSLLNDSTAYYSLLKETTVNGSQIYKGQYSAFSYTFKDVKPKEQVSLKKEYTIKLIPVDYGINIDNVKTGEYQGNIMYLNPEQFIVSNDELIKQKAKEIVGNETNPYKKAQLIFKYVVKNMKYNNDSPISNTGSYSAIRDILRGTESTITEEIKKGLVYNKETGKYDKKEFNKQEGGSCFEYATLFAAMLRSQGIPARVPVGFVVSSEEVSKLKEKGSIDISKNAHAWVEMYIAPYGWVLADPTVANVNSSTPDLLIYKNFAKTNNFYIKQGYSYPFMQHMLPKNVKYEHKVILKMYNAEQELKEENDYINEENNKKENNDTVNNTNIDKIEKINLSKLKNRMISRKGRMSNYYNKIQNTVDKEKVLNYIDSRITNNKEMTRAEMYSIVYSIVDEKGKYSEIKWNDINGHWSENMAKELSKHRILIGYKDKTVRPDKYATKDDIKVIIKRTFNKKIIEPVSTLVKDFIQLLKTLI